MDYVASSLYLASAFALLGSPGPGIAALLAVVRANGPVAALRFYAGLQLGLATAAAISAAGLLSLLNVFPALLHAMAIGAAAYLVYLAYKIALSPVGGSSERHPGHASAMAGALLGITNPKAYIAFASLMGSYTLLRSSARMDSLIKWALTVLVILIVDLAWILVGLVWRRTSMPSYVERCLNICLGLTIIVAAIGIFI